MSHRHFRFLAIFLLVLTGSVGLLQPLDAPSPAIAEEHDGEAIIHIPVRWCAVEGTVAVVDPGALGESDTESVLLKRQARANDRTWLPGADILFRSAFTTAMMDDASFPIIKDPNPPGEGPGDLGDIFDPQKEHEQRVKDNDIEEASELSLAVASCRSAWDDLETNMGETEPSSPLQGPIALNIGRFVDENGARTVHSGWGGYTTWSPKTAHPCVTPSGASTASDGFIAVVDLSVIEDDLDLQQDQLDPAQVDADLIAHELGHVLYLSHGNGEDDDGDTFYDKWCDLWESPEATPLTVMHPMIPMATDVITERQRGTSRDIATIYTGSQIHLLSGAHAPPAATPAWTPEHMRTLGDQRADEAGDVDVRAASVDLTYVELVLNEVQRSVTLTQGLLGLVDPDETNAYFAFLDLDDNPNTGDSPGTLELPTLLADAELRAQLSEIEFGSQPGGVDLVTMVVVDEDRRASVTVWEFTEGEFTIEPDVNVHLTSPEGGEELTPLSDVVTISLPPEVLDIIQEQEGEEHIVRIQAVAANGQELDVLQRFEEDLPSSDLAVLILESPQFPSCALPTEPVNAGDTVTVEMSGFGATDRPMQISLGDQVIGEGVLESGGSSVEIEIPEDAEEGLRLVTVRLENTALTADCALQIGELEPQG